MNDLILSLINKQHIIIDDQESEVYLNNILIPKEIIIEIFSNLKLLDLVRVLLVCKGWKRIGEEESLWYLFCRRDYSLNDKKVRSSIVNLANKYEYTRYEDSWKKAYQLKKMGYDIITDSFGIKREGRFNNSKLYKGKKTYSSGMVHDGIFDDLYLVRGIITTSEGTEEGEFENGWLIKGKITSPDGTVKIKHL